MDALLVDGAFLLLDSGLTAQQGQDVVNSVLLARHVAAQTVAADAGGYANALRQALGNIGWTSTDIATHDTPLTTGGTPLTSIAGEMVKIASADLVDRLVAEVSALERAGPAIRRAWAAQSNQTPARSLLLIATLNNDVPVLVYDYNELAPAEHATGYPWSALTDPGTLSQFSGSAVMNRMVFTTAFSSALATKVAPMRSTAVVPLPEADVERKSR
ncbi:hypothetical protein [Nonomuraea sp. SBT364]|uniref:hypothetical protein n=1 Tax=Nonomuraea sp. SBT364 TaxID=1580530 RepID=UPI00066CC8F9|nr:hypothetical protein [Nonomuraea sp. SBT364]